MEFTGLGPAQSLERLRFELVPITVKGTIKRASYLPHGSKITITCSENLGLKKTLESTKKLSKIGFEVVPHIPARLVVSKTHLEGILRELDDAGVREIFVPGGDSKKPAGEFTESYELLGALSDIGHNFAAIGIAGHPQGHPFIRNKKILTRAIYAKQEYSTYIVTQICSNSKQVIEWIEDLRKNDVTLPVYIGVMWRLSQSKLLKVARHFGAYQTLWFLSRNPGLIAQVCRYGEYVPDSFVKGLIPYLDNCDYNSQGFHINTFNQVEAIKIILSE